MECKMCNSNKKVKEYRRDELTVALCNFCAFVMTQDPIIIEKWTRYILDNRESNE